MKQTVIPLYSAERILAKVQAYASRLDLMLQEGDAAAEALDKAFNFADEDFKLKIVLMLGALAGPKVVHPIYRIMLDGTQNETVRHAAAVQLSLIGGSLPEQDTLVRRLIADLHRQDPTVRANAALALGWEGNQPATGPLVNALEDEDLEVQQAAVTALSNQKDDHCFFLLAERLERAPKEQQRYILYHLANFENRTLEFVRICTRYLKHSDADLRYDALVALEGAAMDDAFVQAALSCLKDPDARVREQALLSLARARELSLAHIETDLHPLLKDVSAPVRQRLISLLRLKRPLFSCGNETPPLP